MPDALPITCPRIVISAAHSGAGKTSLTTALTAALRRKGLRVQTYKVGPDFLDPSYLSRISGRPCYNIDGWMMGKDHVMQLFARTSANADIAVIEGVMGLFDGSDPASLDGSTAQIARWLCAPVVLVAGVHGMARSLAALVKGFAEFEPEVSVIGVIVNHCGSKRHQKHLTEAMRATGGPELLGAVQRGALPEFSSRHLGLVTADDRILNASAVNALADIADRDMDLQSILNCARRAPALLTYPPPAPAPGSPVRLAVADDAAFHFYYADLFEALARRGCQTVRFSPIQDSRLPDDVDGLYLGGGYPEAHAEALSANCAMMRSIRDFAANGRPVYAECGGLMYLSRGIESSNGRNHEFLGILPVWTRMLKKRKALGYVQVNFIEDTLWGERGGGFRGHEFHYSELVDEPEFRDGWRRVYSLQNARGDQTALEGFQKGAVLATYVHAHPASSPQAMDYFLNLCRERQCAH